MRSRASTRAVAPACRPGPPGARRGGAETWADGEFQQLAPPTYWALRRDGTTLGSYLAGSTSSFPRWLVTPAAPVIIRILAEHDSTDTAVRLGRRRPAADARPDRRVDRRGCSCRPRPSPTSRSRQRSRCCAPTTRCARRSTPAARRSASLGASRPLLRPDGGGFTRPLERGAALRRRRASRTPIATSASGRTTRRAAVDWLVRELGLAAGGTVLDLGGGAALAPTAAGPRPPRSRSSPWGHAGRAGAHRARRRRPRRAGGGAPFEDAEVDGVVRGPGVPRFATSAVSSELARVLLRGRLGPVR